jgi:hypothetical protein
MPNAATQLKTVQPGQLEMELTEVDAGILKSIPATAILTINGKALTQPQIDAKVKAYLATIEAADTAKQQYQTALVARRNIQLEARDFYLQLKKVITAYFGVQNPQLADFGFAPAKARVESSKVTVVKAAKAEITRKARGTLSKKQKAAINPLVGSPAVAIGADGKTQVSAPTVVNPVVVDVPQGSAGGSGST